MAVRILLRQVLATPDKSASEAALMVSMSFQQTDVNNLISVDFTEQTLFGFIVLGQSINRSTHSSLFLHHEILQAVSSFFIKALISAMSCDFVTVCCEEGAGLEERCAGFAVL